MSENMNLDKAKEVLDAGVEKAQDLMNDPSQVKDLLGQAEAKLRDIPYVGDDLADVPAALSMVKGYITQQYQEVSPKVIAVVVSALLYLIKGKDLISDKIPVLGQLDDLAVIAAAMKMISPEVQAFKAWKEQNPTAVEEDETEEA